MLHVVSYDIADNTLRTRVAATLARVGERVQESVFECQLDGPSRAALVKTLSAMLTAEPTASIRIYPICADCAPLAVGIGSPRESGIDQPCLLV